MLDQTNDEMADAQDELAKLRAEVERLRVQNEVAKLKAEAEKLRAELAPAAASPPGGAPQTIAERPPSPEPAKRTPTPQPASRSKTTGATSKPAEQLADPASRPAPGKTSKSNGTPHGKSASPTEERTKPSQPAPPVSKPSPPSARSTPQPAAPRVSSPVPQADRGAEMIPLVDPAGTAAKAKQPAAEPTTSSPAAPHSTPNSNPTNKEPATSKPAKPVVESVAVAAAQKSRDPSASEEPAAPAPLGEDEGEHRFGRKFFERMGAFSFSMIAHAAFLIVMAFWVVPVVIQQQLEPLQASTMRAQEELTKVMSESTAATSEISLTAASSSSASMASSSLQAGHGGALQGGAAPSMTDAVSAEALSVGGGAEFNDVGLWGVSNSDMVTNVADGAPGDPSQIVDNYEEAMDRITHEILMALLKGDVLVMWLFDKSFSMKDDQVEIRERFDRVYQELGITPAAQGDHLVTAIGSYGKEFTLHTQKPTSKLSEIRAAIDSIPVDDSGLEHQCPAVGLMINRHRKYATQGKRQLMLVMVTDESGEEEDNLKNLEIAINEAKEVRCPIYLLGREAVFGYPYAYMNWTEPESKLNFWVQINRGPETPYVEQLQTNGMYRRYDAHASGFGPYEQTRMARETGGVFFLLPSPEVNLVGRDNRKYELEAIKPYLPDLSDRQTALAQREKSELRRSLWKVISDLNPWNPAVQPHIEMAHSFSIDPQVFYQQVAAEHAKAVQYFVYLDRCEKEMERLAKLRQKEASPRWRANYDLMFAQILAYKVRLYEYGAYMEAFAKNPKKIKNPLGPLRKTTHWELANRAETLTHEKTGDYIARSKQMFEDVIKNHSGTPWASRAQWELARGFGMELVEDYDDPRRVGLGAKVPKF